MNTIREDVLERRVLVSDGAWGTFLIREGIQPRECPELWNVEHPDVVRGIGEQYIAAGANLITTNSFGGSRSKLERYQLGDRSAELNAAAAKLSREAAGPDRHVIASIGPTGKFLLTGDISEEELYEVFKEQAAALEEGGADACCIETMSAIDEACTAIRAAKESTGLEVICSFTYDREVKGVYRTMMGVAPSEMAEAALEAGADIIGTNCSQGSAEMVAIVKDLRAAAPDVPILVHPNAGRPIYTDEGDTYPETPELMARHVPDLIEAGANIIGGCCGTTPEHIKAITAAVEQALR